MKETPLNKAFDDAMRKIARDPAQQHVARQLAALQQVAVEFHEAGVPVTLAVRPEMRGSRLSPDDDDSTAFANGELVMGDVRLDFVIQASGYGQDQMSLQIFHGDEMMINRTSTFDEENKTWVEDEPEDADEGYDEENGWNDSDEQDDGAKKSPAPDLKSSVSALLVELKTQEDFVARYNVGPNGPPGSAIEKPFSVAAPLKLKKPGAP